MPLWIWELAFDWNSVEGDNDNRLLMEGLVDSQQHLTQLMKRDGHWSSPASPMWIQKQDELKFNVFNVTPGSVSDKNKYKLKKVHIHFKNSNGGTPSNPIEGGDLILNPVPSTQELPRESPYLEYTSTFGGLNGRAFPVWELKRESGSTNLKILNAADGLRFTMSAAIIVQKESQAGVLQLRSFYVDPEMAVGGMNN